MYELLLLSSEMTRAMPISMELFIIMFLFLVEWCIFPRQTSVIWYFIKIPMDYCMHQLIIEEFDYRQFLETMCSI